MTPPDWNTLHDRIDALRRECEELRKINDPERFAAAYETIWQHKLAALRLLIGDQLAERLGVARIARSSYEITPSWTDEAAAAGRAHVAPLSAMSMDEAAAQRRMAAQLFSDFAAVMPPGLSSNMAATMVMLNLGTALPLAMPLRVKGLRSGAGARATAFLFFAMGLYYRVGYLGRTVEDLLKENAAVVGDMSRNAFDKEIRRLHIRPTVEEARRLGREDAAAGKPMRPEWCGDYDLRQLADIMRGSGGRIDARVIPFGRGKR